MDPVTMAIVGAQLGGQISSMIKGKKAQKKAKKAEKRYLAEVETLYRGQKLQYQPGGAFQQKGERDIAEARVGATGAAMQRLIASGMTGGETGMGVESAWEKGVGIPARLTLEDLRMSRLGEIERERSAMLMGQAELATQLAYQAGAATPSPWNIISQGAGMFAPGGGFAGLFGAKTPAYQPGAMPSQYMPSTQYGRYGAAFPGAR